MYNQYYNYAELQLDKLVEQKISFCLETTLSGKAYLAKIKEWQKKGYIVNLIFLSLPSPEMAISRVAYRVKQGGHNIPENVIRRHFQKGLENFHTQFKDCVDYWALYDNSNYELILLESSTDF